VKAEHPTAKLVQILRNDLGFALAKVRSRRPQIQEENFILGEWGFARSIYSECLAARYVGELVLALERGFHVSYAIYWQALDNGWRGGKRTPCVGDLRDEGDPEGQIDWLLYGLFRGNKANLTLAGSALQALLRGQPAPPLPRCPAIEPQGVVDTPESGNPILQPGGSITISGQAFARRGNKILILQAHDRRNSGAPNVLVELGEPNDPLWQESPDRITATVPAEGLHDGCALVWTSSDGVESNAQLVRIKPE
jgi:hypothetical protein